MEKMKFEKLLKDAGIVHFGVDEIFRRNPPEYLWRNIFPTLRVLDEARGYFGVPFVVNSTYRDPAYNKQVGGAPDSLHLVFNAVDFYARDVEPELVYDFLCRMTGSKMFGLGLYAGFVHCDTRGLLGRRAPVRWRK